MSKKLIIATRGSKLALWQAEYIKSLIEKKHRDVECDLNIIKTTGDKILDVPLAKIGGKGLFVKEIEMALLEGKADLAVHSMKDVPMILPDDLNLFASPKEEIPNDAFVSLKYKKLTDLPVGAKVGTSSLRRKLQLLEKRPDLNILDLRGNVQTRMQKLADGVYDAIILAAAGLIRLGLSSHIKEMIPTDFMLPASCQGILGIEIRKKDKEVEKYISFLHDKDAETRVACERAFLRKLEGGCQVPIGCHSVLQGEDIDVKGILFTLDGRVKIEKRIKGKRDNAESIGTSLAEEVLKEGGDNILKEIYS